MTEVFVDMKRQVVPVSFSHIFFRGREGVSFDRTKSSPRAVCGLYE